MNFKNDAEVVDTAVVATVVCDSHARSGTLVPTYILYHAYKAMDTLSIAVHVINTCHVAT